MLVPSVGEKLAGVVYRAAEEADKLGFERFAMRATGLVFGMEYFRGMRAEAGSATAMVAGCVRFLRKAATADRRIAGVPLWLARAASGLTGSGG
jgi:hypothetical protein